MKRYSQNAGDCVTQNSNINRYGTSAAAVADEIKDSVVRISEHPKLAPVVYKGEVRAIVAGRFDYRIFYVVSRDELIIRNVRSVRRQRPWEA